MKLKYSILAIALIITGSVTAQQRLTANSALTSMSWLGEKVVGQHTGTINLKSGWVDWHENKITSGEFIIDMTSIKSDEKLDRLEGHLRSDDFFGVEKNPVSKLVITGSTPFDKGSATLKGNLTIKGITNPVEFKATMQKTDEGTRFFANIVIDRSKYDIRYGSGSFFDNLGDKTIYDEFKLKVNLLLI